MPKWAKNEQ
jgi:hypothetical protein